VALLRSRRSGYRGLSVNQVLSARVLIVALFLCCAVGSGWEIVRAADTQDPPPRHHLLVWAGDRALKGNDFLIVFDADPSSASYGRMITAVGTDQQTVRVHHTEYTMPASGMLFANDHDVGRTFIFDVRNPLQPKVAASFTDMGGFMHPHSFLRLPNGHVLATFQHAHHPAAPGAVVKSGGLVEIDDDGKLVRAASNADPAFPETLQMPYGLVVLPKLDRVLSTNSSMHDEDLFSGVTYQVWRLSDLKLLKTEFLEVGANHYAHISPEEPRLGPDGSVYVQTLACGLERITAIDSATPRSQLVYTFPGNWCGVPTIVGHYFVQSVPSIHGLIVLDLANPDRPVEVSRLTLSDRYFPHWTGWDADTGRLVVTSGHTPEDRLYVLKLDQATGALTVDADFRDTDGKPGISFAERDWPQGWRGVGMPHGAVFTH
jgi:hypothetical protein